MEIRFDSTGIPIKADVMPEKLFEILRKDHEEVRGTLENLMHAKKPDFREKLVGKLWSQIVPHLLAEERSLYPTLRDECHNCRKDVLESFEEHHASPDDPGC